jgi:hypothetical protein
MRRIKIVGLGVGVALAVGAMGAGTAAASPKALSFYEESLPPQFTESFDLYTYSGVTLTTRDGNVECNGNGKIVSHEGSFMFGHLQTNKEATDTVKIGSAGGQIAPGNEDLCNSSIGLGQVRLVFSPSLYEEPSGEWTLSLSASGKVQLTGPESRPVIIQLFFTGGADCEYRSSEVKGRMSVAPLKVRTSISFWRQRFKLAPEGSAPICPRSVDLYADFYAVGQGEGSAGESEGELIYDSN